MCSLRKASAFFTFLVAAPTIAVLYRNSLYTSPYVQGTVPNPRSKVSNRLFTSFRGTDIVVVGRRTDDRSPRPVFLSFPSFQSSFWGTNHVFPAFFTFLSFELSGSYSHACSTTVYSYAYYIYACIANLLLTTYRQSTFVASSQLRCELHLQQHQPLILTNIPQRSLKNGPFASRLMPSICLLFATSLTHIHIRDNVRTYPHPPTYPSHLLTIGTSSVSLT